MPAAVRPYVTAGVALVGASVISVAPIQPTAAFERIVTQDYSLTAASTLTCAPGSPSALCGGNVGVLALPDGLGANALAASDPSLLYVPVNLVNMFLSIPAWEVQAMDRFADAMIGTGSWQVWSPTNVFGFDEWDPPKLKAFVDMLAPIKPFSSVFGDQLSWWARANLPMNAGCAALPGACPDLGALLDSMFKVPMSQLYEGYTFPTVTNPFTGEETSWSGQYVKLEPFGPITSMWDYLTAPPTGPEAVPLSDYFTVPVKLGKALFDAFYPFVQNSEWYNDDQTGLAPFFRALAPVLCKSCTPGKPVYDNPWLYENYPPNQQVTRESADGTAALSAAPEKSTANTETLSGGEENSETSHPVKDAVTGLMKKFEFAPKVEKAAAEPAAEPSGDVAEIPADEAAPASIPEDSGTTDTDTTDTSATDSGPSGKTGIFGKHRKSGGEDDTNSVKTIRDRIASATSHASASKKTASASSDGGSSAKGASTE